LLELFVRVTPETATVADIVHGLFSISIDDHRRARDLTPDQVSSLHRWLVDAAGEVPNIGFIGNEADEHYGRADGIARINGAEIPYCIEAWVRCQHADKDTHTEGEVELMVNRSLAIASLEYSADSYGIGISGCGIREYVRGAAKRASYSITLSLLTPYVRLMNDGKTPFLIDFRAGVTTAVQKACSAAYRAMIRPPRKMTIIAAAYHVMAWAYDKASGGGAYPVKARQVMYAARPKNLGVHWKRKL
jgi:hypothetical protein